MSHRTLLSLLTLFAVLLAPVAALAQDDEPEFEQYTSEDGLLSVSYPSGWLARESGFLYGVELINSQELADLMESSEGPEEGPEDQPFPSGGVVTFVNVVTLDNFKMFGMPMEEGMTLEEMLQVFLDFIAAPPAAEEGAEGAEGGEGMAEGEGEAEAEDAEGEAEGEADAETEGAEGEAETEGGEEPRMQMTPPIVGEIESAEFEDGRSVAWARVEYPGETDDIYLLFELGDGLYAVVNHFAASGELTDDQIELGMQIAESVQFTGTADDLVMAPPEVEESDVDPATLDGNALIDERCTVCHTRDRIDQQDKDEEGWTATVDRMIGYGADLDEAERQAVISYLVETH